MHLAIIGAALMALYASRFENALRPYAAGMSIGAHPEVTAATLPIPSVVLPPPVNLPTSSDAVPLVEEQAAAAQGGGGGGRNALAALAPLALRLGLDGARKLLQDTNGDQQSIGAPQSMDNVYSSQLGVPAQSMDAVYSRALGVTPSMDSAYTSALGLRPSLDSVMSQGLGIQPTLDGMFSNGLGLSGTPSMDALYSAGVQNPVTFEGMAANDLFGGGGSSGLFNLDSMAGNIPGFVFGKAGSMLGASLMGNEWVPNQWTQLAGGIIGSIFGPIGTFAGSMLGSMIGDRANIPRSFTVGQAMPQADGTANWHMTDPTAVNGGPRVATNELRNALTGYLDNRASAEGYAVNPDAIGRVGFAAGMDGDQLYYMPIDSENWRTGVTAVSDRPLEPQNFGMNFGRHFNDFEIDPQTAAAERAQGLSGLSPGLASWAWGDLTNRGFFVPAANAPTWDAVQGQRQAYLTEFDRPDMWSSQWSDNGPVNVSNPGWSFQQGPTYDSGQWVQQALNAPTPNLEPSGA